MKRDCVLFFSYYGEQYSGSPKYISEFLKENSDLRIIWAFTDCGKHTAYDGRKVHYSGLKYYYYLATCKTLITNYRMTGDFRRRKDQYYIQTWHSSLRLKMIEKDAGDTLPENYIKMAKEDSKQISVLLAGSGKSHEIFRRSFWYPGEIADVGTPQCDILAIENPVLDKKVKDYYHIPEEGNVVLYAPTFRKDHSVDVYDLDPDQLLNRLSGRFGGDWYLLIRLHPHLIGKLDFIHYTDHVIQATAYDDVQELLCAADVLLTDYSAIMFDFAVTKRPCFLYTPDLEMYTSQDRRLYFDLDELPFAHFESQQKLFDQIGAFDEYAYSSRIQQFLKDIDSYDDGHAGERVYKLIKEQMK